MGKVKMSLTCNKRVFVHLAAAGPSSAGRGAEQGVHGRSGAGGLVGQRTRCKLKAFQKLLIPRCNREGCIF